NLLRLNTNGTLDTSFSVQADDVVYSLVVQTNSSVVIGGSFTHVNGAPRAGLARLSTNGVLDSTLNPGLTGGLATIYALVLQADGKILLGGSFTNINGTMRTNIALGLENQGIDSGQT